MGTGGNHYPGRSVVSFLRQSDLNVSMNTNKPPRMPWAVLSLLLGLPVCSPAQDTGSGLKTRAELSNYQETSRYADVLAFFGQLRKTSPLIHLQTFGRSHEGRDLPLAIISDPPLTTPREAEDSGKTIVFVLANIHAGEVE